MPASEAGGPGSRVWSRRVPGRVAALALVVTLTLSALAVVRAAAVRAAGAAPPDPVAAPVRAGEVALFGDSLAYQARGVFLADLARHGTGTPVVRTFPTTALCDFRDEVIAELLAHRPAVVVLEFSGNSYTACMRDEQDTLLPIGSAAWRADYLDALRRVREVAHTTGTTIVWATAPPLSPDRFPTNSPHGLATAIRRATVGDPDVRVVDTGAALAADGLSFDATLPCRPGEQAFCTGGRVVVRAADGLHFDCHGATEPLGGCVGYSAGAARFGDALAAAALGA